MTKNISLIEHVMNEMKNYEKLIKESYVFDDENGSYNEEDMIDDYPDDESENSLTTNDKISQIRALALDGIQEFAENVDSEEYDILKKI